MRRSRKRGVLFTRLSDRHQRINQIRNTNRMTIDSENKVRLYSFILLNVFFSFAMTVYCQTDDSNVEEKRSSIENKKIDFIIGTSLLYPTGTFNNENNPRRLLAGYSFGIGFQKLQSDKFEVIVRLLYERKGYKTEYINIDSVGNVSQVYNTQILNYLSFNFLPSVFLGKSKKTKLITGVYFGLLTQDAFKQKVFLNGQHSFSYFANNVKDRFDTYDYGISFGICHTRDLMENMDIGLQLLSNLGLNNIVPNKFTGTIIKPCSLSLSIILTYKH